METIVLGAGMVGVSIAYHLAQRGRPVLLIDRRSPGQETSFGNAGIIQREAIAPYPFPHDLKTLARVLPNRDIAIRYRPSAMVAAAGPLVAYWLNSLPRRYEQIVPEYAALIALSTQEHAPMIAAAGATHLIRKEGWLELYRTTPALDARDRKARMAAEDYGVLSERLTRGQLDRIQPGLSPAAIGAIHWQNSWTVTSPGDLVLAYAKAFAEQGGRWLQAELRGVAPAASGWRVTTDEGVHTAAEVVIALGPWSGRFIKMLDYKLPLFVKRGYHMHYIQPETTRLRAWIMDAEKGYLLEPMQAGIRLTTGAELANLDAPPHYGQLDAAEKVARELFPIGERVETLPWKGARPCTPDMKPIIGPAPKHAGLWFAFGHGHQGFTLGPATGRLLAEMMAGEPPAIDMTPFRVERFCS
ncbi:MAG: FAD-binding oxidoreductase [Candidatus Competibacteraceae bacterium]|nr:FAD-binding oxidoreductase [Candidatus Competibacteraceae bacterium]